MRLFYLHNTPLDSEKANIIQVLYMCDCFSRLGVDVTLAIPRSSKPMTSEDLSFSVREKIGHALSFSIITFPRIRLFGHFDTLGSYFGAMNIINKVKADICLVRTPVFLQLSMNKGIPTIFESHNTLLHNRSNFLHQLWRRKLIQYSKSENLVMFIAISQALANYWISNDIDPHKIISLHDGFDLESFKLIKTKEEARKELGLRMDKKIVVYAGSLYQDRGIEQILQLATIFSNVRFFVLGGPSERKKYFEEIIDSKRLDNIKLMGWTQKDKVRTYLFAADVLLMLWTKRVPTINYCSPLKMFEYMAAGRIIVGNGFPSIKEVLTDGITAHLANPDSFQDLYKKMETALNDRYPSELAQRARELALKEYPWKKRAQKILDRISMEL